MNNTLTFKGSFDVRVYFPGDGGGGGAYFQVYRDLGSCPITTGGLTFRSDIPARPIGAYFQGRRIYEEGLLFKVYSISGPPASDLTQTLHI